MPELDESIPFCVSISDEANIVDQCCLIIEDFSEGDPSSAAEINDSLQTLEFFRRHLDDLQKNLEAIRDGRMSPGEAKGLK